MTGFSGAPTPVITWVPADNNQLLAAYDPIISQSTQTLTAGTIYLIKIKVDQPRLITNVNFFAGSAAGVGASTGSFAGLVSPSGTRLGVSADIGAVLTGTGFGLLVCPLSLQTLVAPPFVWACLVSNLATTQPTLASAQGNGNMTDLGLTPATYRFATGGTGAVSIPATFTPGSFVSTFSLWAGLT